MGTPALGFGFAAVRPLPPIIRLPSATTTLAVRWRWIPGGDGESIAHAFHVVSPSPGLLALSHCTHHACTMTCPSISLSLRLLVVGR